VTTAVNIVSDIVTAFFIYFLEMSFGKEGGKKKRVPLTLELEEWFVWKCVKVVFFYL
jgi:hypothetical protein